MKMKQKLIYSLERMENQLLSGKKSEKINGKTTNNQIPMTSKDVKRLESEINRLKDRINGIKKPVSKKKIVQEAPEKTTWVIDIYAVKFGYINQAAKKTAKKSRGSRKKMKRKRIMTHVQTVTFRPGLLQKYKDGLMGISPKSHVFKLRNTETTF